MPMIYPTDAKKLNKKEGRPMRFNAGISLRRGNKIAFGDRGRKGTGWGRGWKGGWGMLGELRIRCREGQERRPGGQRADQWLG